MRLTALSAALVIVILLESPVALGQHGTPPETTDVQATIVGPDAKPLANTPVEFTETDKHPFPDTTPMHASATTDEHGVARFRWKVGVSQMWVTVKGVGYGMCGLTEFIPHVTAKPAFPPMAPYASLSGTIPKELLGKVTLVRALNGGIQEEPRTTSVDASGQFEFPDLMSGNCSLAAKDAQGRFLAEGGLELNPGVHIQSVKFALNDAKQAEASTHPIEMFGHDPNRGKTVNWVNGMIRDRHGMPLANVDVYAVATYFGGIRMYEEAKKSTTDQTGHYIISGEGGQPEFSGVVVAHKAGFVPALAWFDRPSPNDFVGQPPASQPAGQLDLTLSDVGGTLDVRVLEDQKPAAGVSVVIRGAHAELRQEWAAVSHQLRPEIEAFLYPELKTDANGEAHFKLLMPDMYRVTALWPLQFNGETQGARLLEGPFASEGRKGPNAIAEGIAVHTGQTQSLLMQVLQQDCTAAFEFRQVDGHPLTGDVPFEWSRAVQGSGWSSSVKLDGDGNASHVFESPGLWRVESKHRQSPIRSFPVREPPYDSAEGILAVSALLNGAARPVFTARHHTPGTAEIRVLDVHGQPMHAVVEIRQGDFTPAAMGATDPHGFVRLEGVREWPHLRLSARPIGVDAGDLRPPNADDAALRGRVFFPQLPGLIKGDQVTQIVMQQVPAGYVRGTLHPASGTTLNQYFIAAGEDGWQASYDSATGQYMAGPLVAGKTTIRININGYNRAGEQEVNVIGGDVVHADLTAKITKLQPQDANIMIGTAGASTLSHEQGLLRGKVFLCDGKTPAYGAVVNYVEPHAYQALYSGRTDARGAIHLHGLWQSQQEQGEEPPGGPADPVVVAFMPGACGAVISPQPKPGQELSLVLPPSLILRGKVTVDGRDAQRYTGTIRVYAAYEGKGTLNGMLSVNSTAQADGTFELAGLTPGTYQVQAALDDIWLSDSQTLIVNDQPPRPLALNIGAPGQPVRVKVTDQRGAALGGKTVTIERPAGPLSTAFWPTVIQTDGAGTAWIPTLEAGTHIVSVGKIKKHFEVGVLPRPDAVDVTIATDGAHDP